MTDRRYRCVQLAGLLIAFGWLDGWQRKWFAVDTDRRTFFGLQVAGYHVGVFR